MPKRTSPLRGNYGKYFDVDKKWEKNVRARLDRAAAENYRGAGFGELRDEYSFVPHQDAPNPVSYVQTRKARKEGGFDYGEKRYIYKRVNREEPQAQETQEPVAEEQQPEAKKPLPPRGSTFTKETQQYKNTRLQSPGNQAPKMRYTKDPSQDAIRYGEDLNAFYTNKFIPSLEAEARLTGLEIGESGRFNLDRFIGKVPELGDPKELFEYYSDKIKGKDDDEKDG